MIYILVGVACLLIGTVLGYFIKNLKWGHRDSDYDGTLLICHELQQVQLNIQRDIPDLKDDDVLSIQVKLVQGENDIIVREAENG